MDKIDDKLGVLLCDMASDLRGNPDDDDLRSWVKRTEDLDDDIDHAGALVRQARESGRLNPRRSAGDVRQEGEFAEDLSTEDLPGQHWPEYGGLIANLRNIIGSMDVVADDNPVTTSRSRRRPAIGR